MKNFSYSSNRNIFKNQDNQTKAFTLNSNANKNSIVTNEIGQEDLKKEIYYKPHQKQARKKSELSPQSLIFKNLMLTMIYYKIICSASVMNLMFAQAQQIQNDKFNEIQKKSEFLSQQAYDYDMVQNPTMQLGDGSKLLTDINIFLPLRSTTDSRRAYKQVKAINGCYQWKISQPEFIELQQFKSNSHAACSNVAEVSNLVTKETNSVVWLTARDQSSNTVLTAQIKVAKIHRIEIFTRFRQVSTRDQIHLQALAYDAEGNVFSSLDGLRFDWQVISGNQNLRRIPWYDSSQIRSHGHQHKEDQIQDQGDDFVLKALQPGHADISVQIMENGYENIKKASIKLTFVDPFIVKPADNSLEFEDDEYSISILPVSEFDFKTQFVIKEEDNGIHYEDVKFTENYRWSIIEDSKNIGQISQKGKFQSKTITGLAEIHVVDKKFETNTADAIINVVEPYQLQLEVADVTNQYLKIQNQFDQYGFGKKSNYQNQLGVKEWDSNWIFVEQRYYLIKAQLFDQEMKKITLTDNIEFKIELKDKYLKKIHLNKIGSEILVFVNNLQNESQKAQKTVFKANLEQIKSKIPSLKYEVNKKKLTVEKEIIITSPVQIVHQTDFILLPQIRGLDGQNIGEILYLQGSGGSGSYQWETSDPEIAIVKQQAYIRSNQLGKTQLWLRDHKNPKNFVTMVVEVQQVQHFEWLEQKIEVQAESNKTITLNAIARDQFGRKFSNCSSLNLDYFYNKDHFKIESIHSSWQDLQQYILEKEINEILILKDYFEKNPQIQYSENLKINKIDQQQLIFNSFGICDQVRLKPNQIGGLSRVKAQIKMHGNIAESEDAEIAIYQQLKTVGPSYQDYLKDLYSSDQTGQEFQSFMNFIPLYEKFENAIYSLAYGSQIEIELNGGSNFWKSTLDEYQTSWRVKGVNNRTQLQNTIEIQLQQQLQTNTSLIVKCTSPFNPQNLKDSSDFDLSIVQRSKKSSTLLRPVTHEETLRIHCSTPTKLRLLWSQPLLQENSNEIQNTVILPASRIHENQRKHFVMLNTQYYLRCIMIDDQGFALFNFDSIDAEFLSSNSSIAQLASSQSLFYRQVVFNSIVGSVKLQSKASNYALLLTNEQSVSKQKSSYWGGKSNKHLSKESQKIANSLIQKLQDNLNVEVVQNAILEPLEKTIYFQGKANPFTFQINHGSGYFSVKINDSNIAEVHVTERQVKIVPKSIGSIEIKIEDIALPESSPAISLLHISNIAQLNLHSIGYLIEQNQALNISVSAKDFYGINFDQDQYEKMNFELQTEMTGVHKTSDLEVTKVKNNKREFQIIGIEPGSYLITAFIYNELINEKVTSQAKKIEVFPTLQLYPTNLLLTPNMRYTLEVIGGPQLISRKSTDGSEVSFVLDIKDRQIATIDAFNEILAHQVGDTQLEYRIIHTKEEEKGQVTKNLISKRTIQIRVRLVTSIEIPHNRQRVIFSGSLLKQIAVMRYNNETFSHGIAPISYSWNSSHQSVLKSFLPQDITDQNQIKQLPKKHQSIKIRNNQKNDDNASFSTSFNSSSIYSKALSQGQAELNVKMAIDYPSIYKNEKNWFETSTLIQVKDMLSISVPVFQQNAERETHLYLIPRNSLSKIQTNNKNAKLKMGYSLQSIFVNTTNQYEYRESTSPIIELIEGVGIKSLDKYGKVTVILEENQSYGAQLVMLNLLITDIYSINAQNFYEALSLHLGSTMQIPLSFQNENAHVFAKNIEGIRINFKLSHPRVVRAQLDEYNQTLSLTSLSSGECNILIYLEDDPSIYDIFRIRVSTMLQPSSPVFAHVGSQIQFKIIDDDYMYQSKLDPYHKHQWTSQNSSVFIIDQNLGNGVSLTQGTTEINLLNSIQAQSTLIVSQVNQIELSQNNLIINIDDESDRNSRLRLKVYLKDQDVEMMPVYWYEGQSLIRQNVKIDCVSDHPEYLKASGESNDLEGFFCNLKYIGSSQSYMKAPKKINIQVYASSLSRIEEKSNNRQKPQIYSPFEYKNLLKQFEIKLTGGVYIDKAIKGGQILLNQSNRKRIINVLSLSNFVIETEDQTVQILDGVQHERDNKNIRLLVGKTKESADSNQFNLTFRVPNEIKDSFQTNLILRSQMSGASAKLVIKFDISANLAYNSNQKVNDNSQSIENGGPSGNKQYDIKASEYDNGQSSYTSYIILFFIITLGIIFICDPSSQSFLIFFKDIFQGVSNLFDYCLGKRASRNLMDQSSNRSFYSIINEQRRVQQNQKYENYNQIRERPIQDKRIKEEAPRYPDGSITNRGSVISPQSMQQSAAYRIKRSDNKEEGYNF